jgi:hypothetical protein
VTNDVSPYLQRPVRTLEEAILEAEQQRLEQAREAANGPFADRSKPGDASAALPNPSSADIAQAP